MAANHRMLNALDNDLSPFGTGWELIGWAQHDDLGGGRDWQSGVRSEVPEFIHRAYEQGAVPQMSDLDLLEDLNDGLMRVGSDQKVVDRILTKYRKASESSAGQEYLWWQPGSLLSKQVDDSNKMAWPIMYVTTVLDRAVGQDHRRPLEGLKKLQLGDWFGPNLIPNFTSGFFGKLATLVGAGNPVQGPLGGTQKLFAVFNNYRTSGGTAGQPSRYEYELSLVIGDDFGVDDQDVTKYNSIERTAAGTAFVGLAAFWVLQHMRGYQPFSNLVGLKVTVSGSVKSRGMVTTRT